MSYVSILTVTQYNRHETLKLLFEIIKNQTCNTILEWVIVEGSNNLNDACLNKKLIKNMSHSDFNIKYIEKKEDTESYIGALRNIANKEAEGDILVWMDDDDYYFNTYVEHCVDTLNASSFLLAGCSKLYLYDLVLEKSLQLDFTFTTPYHSTNNALAYKKEYLINHRYKENIKFGEESSFTNNFTEKMEQMNPDKVMVHLAHSYNTFNKRDMIITASLQLIKGWNRININLKTKIPNKYYDNYKKHLVVNSETEYDISYLTSNQSIVWCPTDLSLGGSEHAIVNLSENWVKLGKKVAVYGRFENEITHNGVDYIKFGRFPFEKKLKTVILWRSHGLVIAMYFYFKAKELIVDFHDNFSYTLNNLDRGDLKKIFERVDKINFKSQYHKDSFDEFMGYKLPARKYNIILNGVRVEPFLVKKNEWIRQPYRFCYCSCYTRGLEAILTYVWPVIWSQYKDELPELHVMYGMHHIHDINYKNKMIMLLGQPGVIDHGRIGRDMVVREKNLSTFHLYLSNSIAEIDCISIRESAVTGCIPILSNFGVFKERDGLHFDWESNNADSMKKVANEICLKMKDFNLIENLRKEIEQSKTIVDWSIISKQWLDTFE